MIKTVKLENSAWRIVLTGAALFCLMGIFFFAKWAFANTIALQSVSQSERVNPQEMGEFAINLASSDPQTHYALAVLYDKSFVPDDQLKSLAEYELATSLAPNDFRLWLALGKARERNGDAAGAENALRKTVSLAPNYSQVHWTLGNILLRQGKTAEAFAEIRQAAENDATYASPAVLTAWQTFDGDIPQINQNLGDSSQTRVALAVFAAKQKRFDEAFETWNSLPDTDKKTVFKQNSDELFKLLLEAKKYRTALQIQKQISETASFSVGKISNGDFESNEKTAQKSIFEWQIADGAQPQSGIDASQKHGGSNSFGFVFNSLTGRDFREFSQTVAVEPAKKYIFETFYKTELKTSATLRWEITNAADGKVLAATEAVSANADWTSLGTEFTAPDNSEAVIIRLVREQCKSAVCPISGKVWFDDFNLTGN